MRAVLTLQKQLQTTGLMNKYSLETVFLSLENIRWLILPEKKNLITEIGKKQRTFLDALTILPEVNNYVATEIRQPTSVGMSGT